MSTNLDEVLGPEPVVEEQPVPETEQQSVVQTQQESQPEPQPEKQTPEQIVENYKKMAHAERMERKELQAQMRQMQERFEKLYSVMQPQPEATPEPVYEDDPIGATFTKVDKVAKSVEELKAVEEQRRQTEAYHGFVKQIQAEEAAFMQKTPDYRDAVTFVQGRRMAELKAMGYDEQSAMQVLAQDAYAVSVRAQQLGESPAAFIYNMAKQLGYTGKQQPNLEVISQGQQVAKSLAGGAQPVSEGSLPPNLAELSDAEFENLFKQMSKG